MCLMQTKSLDVAPNAFARFIRGALLWFYRRQGWTAVEEGKTPSKCIIIAAPHTSNWDFVYYIGLVSELNAQAHFMAKKSLFRWPFGGFMRSMGGVSVDRSGSNDMVQAMIAEFKRRDHFRLTIAPEGTRGSVRHWRTGFYHIAMGAGVPLVVGMMDYGTKTGGLGKAIMPTGDYEKDMAEVMEFYAKTTPRHPDKAMTAIVANKDTP
jgi:1-acyl-sn-glycerol-3-phosphate acyltransferase